jgi:hypothetical protein
MKYRNLIVGLIAGLVMGITGGAVATTAASDNQPAWWMHRDCYDVSNNSLNCYWDGHGTSYPSFYKTKRRLVDDNGKTIMHVICVYYVGYKTDRNNGWCYQRPHN